MPHRPGHGRSGTDNTEADRINKQIADHLENESSFATRNFLKTKITQNSTGI